MTSISLLSVTHFYVSVGLVDHDALYDVMVWLICTCTVRVLDLTLERFFLFFVLLWIINNASCLNSANVLNLNLHNTSMNREHILKQTKKVML